MSDDHGHYQTWLSIFITTPESRPTVSVFDKREDVINDIKLDVRRMMERVGLGEKAIQAKLAEVDAMKKYAGSVSVPTGTIHLDCFTRLPPLQPLKGSV